MVKGTQSKEQRMKKRIVWLTAAIAAFGLIAQAETVITSPTGLPDESDVVLESAVKAVKEIPADTVNAVGGAVSFTGDELRNTAHGIKSAFEGDTPRETVRDEMLGEVAGAWGSPDEILFRSYKISAAVGRTMAGTDTTQRVFLDVKDFFSGVDFPEGASARFQPEYRKLLVRNTLSNIHQIERMLAKYHHAERDYRQVEIKAKFIEVSQSTLNELGFSWDITADTHLDGDWWVKADSSLAQTALRSAAGAFGGDIGAGQMVLTKGGWMPLELTISALEQNSDSDVLSSPSLTATDGKEAQIWVGEDRAVPKGFDVGSADINIHIEHKFTGTPELIGVRFSVTPEILKNDLIRLKLNPKIVDLIGYDTYKVSPNASMMIWNGANPNTVRPQGLYPILKYAGTGVTKTWQGMSDALSDIYGSGADPNSALTWPGTGNGILGGNTVGANPTGPASILYSDPAENSSAIAPYGVAQQATPNSGYHEIYRNADHATFGQPLVPIYGQLPYFRVREVKTQVDVADGSTVGLGGLIYDRLETYKDKVPVLGSIPVIGRLFRSEGERSIKRNLMIFVSANQLANDGQRKSNVAINN
jgi:general secretion pathway protein D